MGDRQPTTSRGRQRLRVLGMLPLLLFTVSLLAAFNSDLLGERARRAFEAKDFVGARREAQGALLLAHLTLWPNRCGDGYFAANLVLGRLALRADRVSDAEAYLLAASRTGGSPVLRSFGPNMSLAKELLERADRDPVLQFLANCRNFWTDGSASLELWSEQVRRGALPDFGPNLKY